MLAVGVAQAEPPGRLSARFVRTSLDGPPHAEFPLPPRLITSSLEPRNMEVLGGEIAPRALRRSLTEDAAPQAPQDPGAGDAPVAVSSVVGEPPSATFPDDGAPIEAAAPSATPEAAAELVSAPSQPTLEPGLGTLECDCARSGRKIRLTLEGSAALPATESARIIRVEL